MKRIILIKQKTGCSKNILYLYGRIFLEAIITEMRRRDLFTSIDYLYSLKELNNEVIVLTINFSSLQEDIVRDVLKTDVNINHNSIQRGIDKIRNESRKDFIYDLETIEKKLMELAREGWNDFEDFPFYSAPRNSRIDNQLIRETGDLNLNKNFILARLKGPYLTSTTHAPLLFRLVIEPLFMQIVHTIQEKLPCKIDFKDTYEKEYIVRLMEYSSFKDVAYEEMADHIEKGLTSINTPAFIKSLQSYINNDMLTLPRSDLIMDTLFRATSCIAGKTQWQSIVTHQNIREMLNHTSLHIGSLDREFIFDHTIGEYLFSAKLPE